MQVSVVKLPVKRGPMITTQVEVGEHEIPVLQSVHGDECLVGMALPTNEVRNFEPREEFQRLVELYGEEDKTGQPHVVVAYGTYQQFEREVRQLDTTKSKAKATA